MYLVTRITNQSGQEWVVIAHEEPVLMTGDLDEAKRHCRKGPRTEAVRPGTGDTIGFAVYEATGSETPRKIEHYSEEFERFV